MDVLLSIKPEFAQAILSGKKRFEFRKVIFQDSNVKKVYVYASRPVGMVIGEFEIDEILSADPDSLWESTKEQSGISKDYFDDYFKGRDIGYALKVSTVHPYQDPIPLSEKFKLARPPQSFMYV